jgi:dihydrofolate reductase
MARIVVSDNVSLDGVIEDPAGDEGFSRGGWVGPIRDRPGIAQVALDEAIAAEALLMGRRTYEWFAARWPSRTGELADRLNGMPKYVVSTTLEDAAWSNSTVLRDDPMQAVTKLKQELKREIVVPASFHLVAALLDHDLIDELRLRIFPVVLGAGARLFGETRGTSGMHLADVQTVDGDIVFLTYTRARDA